MQRRRFYWHTAGQLRSELEIKNNETVYSASYTYTPYGNRARMNYTSGGTTEVTDYTYDANNRLTSYNSGSAEATYMYDADNLRASKTVNRAKTDFVWDGQNLATEHKSDATNTYAYDMTGVHIANQDGVVTSYLKDFHGNIVGKTTAAGAMVQELNNRMDYDAFGNQWIGETPDPFGYCGEYYDEESGLTYLRNRYYNSNTGRFISEDPVKYGLNWYVYCSGNPIALVDPLGLTEKAPSKVPGDLDWDGDGFMDTKSDRKRFDSNNNNIADWIEDGYETAEDWYVNKTYNIIPDFTLIEQEGDTCSFTSMGMIILQLTGQKISYRYMAENELENNKTKAELYSKWYEFGMGITDIKKHIVRNKYFQGSNYNVGKKYHNDYLTPDTIKENIDAGIPILLAFDEHVRVIVGYNYNNGNDIMIIADPAHVKYKTESYSNMIENHHFDILLFNRVR